MKVASFVALCLPLPPIPAVKIKLRYVKAELDNKVFDQGQLRNFEAN